MLRLPTHPDACNVFYGFVYYNTTVEEFYEYTDDPYDPWKIKPIMSEEAVQTIVKEELKEFKSSNVDNKSLSLNSKEEITLGVSTDKETIIDTTVNATFVREVQFDSPITLKAANLVTINGKSLIGSGNIETEKIPNFKTINGNEITGSGDIKIVSDILTSPNGSKFKLTIDDEGSLITTKI